MSVENKQAMASDFNPHTNHLKVEQSENVKCLGVQLNSKLSRKAHIEKYLACKLSEVSGMIYKIRYYVLLSTLKMFYYAVFHSHLRYSLP